jgi:hypothetical protein
MRNTYLEINVDKICIREKEAFGQVGANEKHLFADKSG